MKYIYIYIYITIISVIWALKYVLVYREAGSTQPSDKNDFVQRWIEKFFISKEKKHVHFAHYFATPFVVHGEHLQCQTKRSSCSSHWKNILVEEVFLGNSPVI